MLDLSLQTVALEQSALNGGAAPRDAAAWQPVEDLSDRAGERYTQFRQRYDAAKPLAMR